MKHGLERTDEQVESLAKAEAEEAKALAAEARYAEDYRERFNDDDGYWAEGNQSKE